MNGLFDKMSPEDMARVMAILQRQPQQEPMLTGESPFTKFDFTPMLAAGDGASSQYHKTARKQCVFPHENAPGCPGATQTDAAPQGYGLGKATKGELELRARQEATMREPGKNDLYLQNAMKAYKGILPDAEIIKRADAKRATGAEPIFR